MRSRCLFAGLLASLGCSPPAAPPCTDDSAYGGATFAVWPPPTSSAEDATDNPWLNGEAVGQGSGGITASGGATGGGPASGPASSGGAPASPPTGTASGGGSQGPPPPEPARLLLRAYVESTTSFKGVLVEHVGGDPSGACSVDLYSNGSTEVWRSLDLPASLGAGERALLCVPDGASPACTVGFGGSVFNGNDALVLRCDGQTQDTLGVVGVDPGKGWAGNGYDGQPLSTVDQGLWRCSGDAAGAFAPADWMRWDWENDPSWVGPTCPDPDLGAAGAPG